MIPYERKRGPMKEFKLHLENDLLGRIQEAAKGAGLSTNQMIVNVLEENFQGQMSFDYAAALAELVREAQSRSPGECFVLADLDFFSRLGVSTAEKGRVQPSTVRARLGRTFNRAVSQGQVPGIARATTIRDGKTVLRFLSGTAVYVREEKQKGENDMKTLKVLEWNIHQQGGCGGGLIPPWVLEEMTRPRKWDESEGLDEREPDIIICTEFCFSGERDEFINRMGKARESRNGPLIYPNPEKAYQDFLKRGFFTRDVFIKKLKEKKYDCRVSENMDGNDVLIAVRDCYQITNKSDFKRCYGVAGAEEIPENCRVDIRVGEKMLTVFGVRIKTISDFSMRRSQFTDWLLSQLSTIGNPVIVAGDFNNNRRGSPNKDWSLAVIDRLLSAGFKRYTPEGSSIYETEPEGGSKYEFAEDHFIAKGITLKELFPYSRKFARRDSIAYPWGEDFREPMQPGLRYKDLETVLPPYPDHAILKAEFVLE